MKAITLTIALLLLTTAGGNAWADHRHHGRHGRLNVVIGPYWGPRLYAPFPSYYPPYPYYSPIVVERPAPQVYIEQPALVAPPPAPIAEAPTNYWYYCTAAGAYYPYVKECPDGWQTVVPQPQQQR